MTIYTLPINLNAIIVTKAENNAGLSTLDQDGLHLSTGAGFYDNVSYSQLLDTSPSVFFPFGQAPLIIGAIGAIGGASGSLPTTLTTALFEDIGLVAGTTLTITYNYNSTEATSIARTTFGETPANDFAFAVLGAPTATTMYGLLARTDIVMAANITPTSIWSESFEIT